MKVSELSGGWLGRILFWLHSCREDKEYSEALARMRNHNSNITAETVEKFKAMDLPEIAGNLSRKRFFFF